MMNVQNFEMKHLVGNDRYRKVCCQKWLFPKGRLYIQGSTIQCWHGGWMLGQCIGSTIASSTHWVLDRLTEWMASLDSLMLALAAAASPLMDMARSMPPRQEEDQQHVAAAAKKSEGQEKDPLPTEKVDAQKPAATDASAPKRTRQSGKSKDGQVEPPVKKAKWMTCCYGCEKMHHKAGCLEWKFMVWQDNIWTTYFLWQDE